MNSSIVGWGLAAAAVALGWWQYGWRGIVLAASVIVFWLLLQFSRALRAVKNASGSPVGHVGSAVMFNTKLRPGMTMVRVLSLTGSLGRKVEAPGADHRTESWSWADEGDSRVTLTFVSGKLRHWHLHRPTQAGDLGDKGGADRAGVS